jgi:fructose-bisphosphate aldolase class I
MENLYMSRFIAAMDHSGGSTGGVLERYGESYTEENKMEKVHAMRQRMINSPLFTSDNIWAAILYQDTVERGMVPILKEKGIESYLKIDSGCEEDGSLKEFNIPSMLNYALRNKCTGTKMRSIVKEIKMVNPVLNQQFKLAETIYASNLMPIIEPEVPIDHQRKGDIEQVLVSYLKSKLDKFNGKCILKLTLPEVPNLYRDLIDHPNVHKIVGLSGGYNTHEACRRLTQNNNMSASFSRALSEGLLWGQTMFQFNDQINDNIKKIVAASG